MCAIVSGVAAVLLVGCTSYHNVNSYMVPNWTPDGKIIAMRVEQTMASGPFITEQSIGGRLSIVKMNDDGSNEQELMEINEQSVKLLVGSPQGNYLAYIDANGNMKVFHNEGGWRLKWLVPLNNFPKREDYDNIHFNPSETMIYVSEGTSQFKIYGIDGTEIAHESQAAGGGEFMTDNEIILNQDTTTDLKLSKYVIGSNSFSVVRMKEFVDRYVALENSVVNLNVDNIVKRNLDTDVVATTNFSYAPYEYHDFVDQHLSPDGKKLVMARDIGLYPQGIYILNVEQSTVEQLR